MAIAAESVVVLDAPGVTLALNVAVAEAVHTLDAPKVSQGLGIGVQEQVVVTELIFNRFVVASIESVVTRDVPSVDAPYNATVPIVLTLPASATTNYSAFLNGSVNPKNNIAQWWFDWGPTNTYGMSTAIMTMAAGAFPLTVGVTIGSLGSPLTTGQTYHFRVSASTDAGTVHGADQTFIAQTPPVVATATTPLVPYGSVGIPHFNYPLVVVPTGAVVAEQGSLEEIFACVRAIVDCPVGECPELPSFGIPNLAFAQGPPPTDAFVTAIQNLEPRAEESAVTASVDYTGGQWTINADTSVQGATLK